MADSALFQNDSCVFNLLTMRPLVQAGRWANKNFSFRLSDLIDDIQLMNYYYLGIIVVICCAEFSTHIEVVGKLAVLLICDCSPELS